MSSNCGQLFLTGLSGTSLLKEERDFIANEEVAGVVLFSKNYESKKQLITLISDIQNCSKDKKIIAVDHEGGRVQRFRSGFSIVPSAREIAEEKSAKKCFEIYSQIARELNQVGVNLNLAPCSDILTNPNCEVIGDRSFGRDVEVVGKFVSAAIRGLQKNKVLACAKHFPGHGDTYIDSHNDLPISERSFELLEKEDIEVFKIASRNKVSLMMMAHLLVPELDPDFPASLSKKSHDYLVDNLNFRGIIISDDMEMGAITKNYGAAESAELAIRAGTHLVEYRSFDACREVVNSLNKKYEEDNTFRTIVDQRKNELDYKLNNIFLSI